MKLPNPVREIRTTYEPLGGADAAARRLGDASPGPEHLLFAVLDMGDGSVARPHAPSGRRAWTPPRRPAAAARAEAETSQCRSRHLQIFEDLTLCGSSRILRRAGPSCGDGSRGRVG